MSVEAVAPVRSALLWSDLCELAKPRITFMVIVTAAAGAFLADPGWGRVPMVLEALVAIALLSSAGAALNQVVEADADALMARTRRRPLAAQRLDRLSVAAIAATVSLLACMWLALRVNLLSSAIGAATLLGYVFVYTPMKRMTPLATWVGAVPGALPPVIGYAAVANRIDGAAWLLFWVLFLWQIPHFLAIGWMYRADYRQGGFPVLPVIDREGRGTAWAMIVFCLLLVGVTLVPGAIDGTLYRAGALLLGAAFLWFCLQFARHRSRRAASRVLLASVLYLPAVLAWLALRHLGVS